LTREGEIFLLEARQILDHVDKARRAVNQTAAGELGRLRVAGVPHAFTEMLPSIIPRFRREKPNILLDLRHGATQESLDAVLAGSLDVAFVRQEEPMEGLEVLPLTSGVFEVVVPAGHRFASAGLVNIADLVAEPFVMPSRNKSPCYYRQTLSILMAAGIAPRTVLEADSMQAQLGYVACGMGVALVPTSGHWIHTRNVSWVPLSIEFGASARVPRPKRWSPMAPSQTNSMP
jgi:DNA-binding transcriptional LysR family regulator